MKCQKMCDIANNVLQLDLPNRLKRKKYHDADTNFVNSKAVSRTISPLQALRQFLRGIRHNTQITLKHLFLKCVDFVYLLKFRVTFISQVA